MAAYWLSLRRNKSERLGFSTKTAEATIAAVERMRGDGWDEIRIIDPNGEETSELQVRRACESARADVV